MSVNSNLSSIIIPVLNEPNLPNLITELNLLLKDQPHEIIVVTSDKKSDDTSLYGRLYLNTKFYRSYGDSLERAILLGFSVAKGTKIVVMDADGSHPESLVPALIYGLDDYEMVVASRFTLDGQYVTSSFRYFVSWFYTRYAQLLGSTLNDPMSGFFSIRSSLLGGMRFKPLKWKTALEINNKLRPKTLEVPYKFVNRKFGRSKSSWKVAIRLIWDILEGAL
jgi:dolichol-phosphate mannosyltransferase